MNSNKKPQAASHMFWFFLLPCLAFMGWSMFKLFQGMKSSPAQNTLPLVEQVKRIQSAKSPGDRWQNAYTLSKDIQKLLHAEGINSLSTQDRNQLFSELGTLLEKNSDDLRLKRYLILTLGQMLSADALPILEKHLDDRDSEIKFFAAWGVIEILLKNPALVTEARLNKISSWLNDKDSSLQKVTASFLVQQKDENSKVLVRQQLKSPDYEIRWNAAVALASVGDATSRDILIEIFDPKNLKNAQFQSLKDLEQLLAAGVSAVLKLNDPEVTESVQKLRDLAKGTDAESQAIRQGLSSLPLRQTQTSDKAKL